MKTGEFAGQKAGDKIVHLLSKKNKTITTPNQMTQSPVTNLPLSQYEFNERVNRINSGGRMRRIKQN